MQVYVDDMDTAVINMPLSLKYALKLTEGTALVGFTAATGSMWQNHDILDWRFQVPASPRRRCPPFACAHGMRHAPRALLSAVAENARKLGPHDTRRARHATSTTGSAVSPETYLCLWATRRRQRRVPSNGTSGIKSALPDTQDVCGRWRQEYSADPEADCLPGLISRSQCLQVGRLS